MSKMFRFVLVAALAAVLISPVASATETKLEGEKSIYATRFARLDPGLVKPDTTPPGNWMDSTSFVIAKDDSVWMGTWNSYRDNNFKQYTLFINGTGDLFNLREIWTKGYLPDPAGPEDTVKHTPTARTVGDGVVAFHSQFRPQPEWEVILIKNTSDGPITVTSYYAESTCRTFPLEIPSLTTYGIIVLVLLLLVSTVWVIRKKKAGVPA